MKVKAIVGLALCSLLVVGCDKYPNTPEGVARKAIDAGLEGDVGKAISTLPTYEELSQIADTAAQLKQMIKRQEEAILEMVKGFCDDNRNLHCWHEDDFKCLKTKELNNNYNVAIAEVGFTMCERKDGKIHRDRGTVQAIRINGRWVMMGE